MMTETEVRRIRKDLLYEAQNMTGETAIRAQAQLYVVDHILGLSASHPGDDLL